MGTSIGQVSATLVAARRESPVVRRTTTGPAEFGLQRAASDGPQNGLSRTDPEPLPQAGFGPGTVSGPAAALVALGRGVAAAREAIPTLDELRAQFQASRAARAAESNPESETVRTEAAARRTDLGFRIPEADPLALNRFNEALGFSQDAAEATGPVELASARPPEAPDFASAAPPDAGRPEFEDAEPVGVVPEFLQQRRLDLTA